MGWGCETVSCEVQQLVTVDFLDKVGFVFVGLVGGPVREGTLGGFHAACERVVC